MTNMLESQFEFDSGIEKLTFEMAHMLACSLVSIAVPDENLENFIIHYMGLKATIPADSIVGQVFI